MCGDGAKFHDWGGFPVAEKPQETLPVTGLYEPSEQAWEGGVKHTGVAEA